MYHRIPESKPSESPRPQSVTVLEPPVRSHRSDWSQPVQTVLDHPPSNLPAWLAIGGLAFSLSFLTWANFSQISEVARAQGKLTPKGDVFKVNPVELGKVAQVHVTEGQAVKAGQVLLELDSDLATSEIKRLEKELAAAQTEANQTELLIGQARLQAQAKRAMAQAQTRSQAQEVIKAESTIGSTELMLAQLQSDADAHQARLDRLQPLAAQGAIAQESVFQAEQGLRERERSLTENQGNLERSRSEAKRLRETLAQQQAEEQNIALESQQQIEQLNVRLAQLRAKASQIQTAIESATTKLKDRFLYAPASGIVSTLNVHNPGEVVQAGQAIAEIAPQNRPMVVSAVLPNQEAGFVKPGMSVQLKLDAFPYQTYGVVPGKVRQISPDAKPDEKLGQVYRMEIELDRNYVMKDDQKVFFKSGQTASVEIVTRQRRVMDVLLEPIHQLQNGGLTL
jgi:HlyD family secretion protein